MLYGAYGSNLNKGQMKWRCPGAVEKGTAVLKGYRLLFKGSRSGSYLTVERAKGCEVPIGLWDVQDGDIERLDIYEGYPTFYYKKRFVLPCSDGKKHVVFVYIMHEEREMAIPSNRYMAVCRDGYKDFDFDLDVLEEALEFTERSIA